MENAERIRNEPMKFLTEWMNSLLLHTGEKIMPYISLIPCSMILPNIPFDNSSIRAPMNVMLIAPPSAGKSTLINKFKTLAYFPVSIRDTTEAGMRKDIEVQSFHIGDDVRLFTILIEDIAMVADDSKGGYASMKFLEGALGDEQRIDITRQKGAYHKRTKAAAFVCATPEDVLRYINNMHAGFFSRVIPIIIYTTLKQHEEIGRHIADKVGISHTDDGKEEVIHDFYQELFKIQFNLNKDIEPITSYEIQKEYKDKAFEVWNLVTKKIVNEFQELNHNFFREFHEFYRFLITHAFLHIFNRNHDKGILVPNSEDFDFALKMMKENLNFKYRLLKADKFMNDKRNMADISMILQEANISEDDKNLMRTMAEAKGVKIGRRLSY